VWELRKYIVKYFENAGAPTAVLEELPADQREAAAKLRLQDVVLRSWSDTTVVTVPLRNPDNRQLPRMVDVHRTLVAVAGAMLAFLACGPKLLLRGGIDVGRAIDLPLVPGMPDTKEIYGAVVGRAYALESKVAEYPRIVVGDTMLRMLESVEAHAASSDVACRFAARMATLCRELLIRDPLDGRAMVDFMGSEIRRMAGVTVEMLRDARTFVASGHARFVGEKNDKLAVGYGRLLNYCERSVAIAESESANATKPKAGY
jgi:hypothetical protein